MFVHLLRSGEIVHRTHNRNVFAGARVACADAGSTMRARGSAVRAHASDTAMATASNGAQMSTAFASPCDSGVPRSPARASCGTPSCRRRKDRTSDDKCTQEYCKLDTHKLSSTPLGFMGQRPRNTVNEWVDKKRVCQAGAHLSTLSAYWRRLKNSNHQLGEYRHAIDLISR
jgi:hypothetical protein